MKTTYYIVQKYENNNWVRAANMNFAKLEYAEKEKNKMCKIYGESFPNWQYRIAKLIIEETIETI